MVCCLVTPMSLFLQPTGFFCSGSFCYVNGPFLCLWVQSMIQNIVVMVPCVGIDSFLTLFFLIFCLMSSSL